MQFFILTVSLPDDPEAPGFDTATPTYLSGQFPDHVVEVPLYDACTSDIASKC